MESPQQARKRSRSLSPVRGEQKRSRSELAQDVGGQGDDGADAPAFVDPLAAPFHPPPPLAPPPLARLGHTDYTFDAHGNVRYLDRGRATMAFMRHAEEALPNATADEPEVEGPVHRGARGRLRKRERQLEASGTDRRERETRLLEQASASGFRSPAPAPVVAGMPTLQERAQDVSTLLQGYRPALAQHEAGETDRFAPIPFPDRPESGTLTRSYANQYRMPDWNPSAPSASSAFAGPRGADGSTLETIYNNDAGMFSTARFNAPTPLDADHQTLLASAEASRGPGAGLAQLLAHDVRPTAGIQSRNEYYGRGSAARSVPGFVPASYSGSQLDIALASRDAADGNEAGIRANPLAAQVGEVLSLARRPAMRRAGSAGLPARPEDYEDDAAGHLDRLGLPARPDDDWF